MTTSITSAASAETKRREAIAWDTRLMQVAMLIGRLGLAFLFFSQLFWKVPPHFGCGQEFAFTGLNAEGQIVRTSGLCDWLGVEAVYAVRERSFFITDFNNDGAAEIALSLAPLVRLNGIFVENVVMPNISWFGWLIFLAEAFIAVSLFFGIFSRLGALTAAGISIQLMLGLAGIWDPAAEVYEWEWTYHLMILLSIVLLGAAPGRFLGVDAALRPRLKAAAEKGNRPARLLLAFT